MRLFAGTSEQFLEDTVQNQIAEKLRFAFFGYFRYYPSPGELNSWRNSLRAVSMVFQNAKLTDQGILLEYQLPMTSERLDCMICGKDAELIIFNFLGFFVLGLGLLLIIEAGTRKAKLPPS